VLCYASSGGHNEVLEPAFNKGPTIYSENTHWSPFHWACRSRRAGAVELPSKEGLRSESVPIVQPGSESSLLTIVVFHSNQDVLVLLSPSCKALLGSRVEATNIVCEQHGRYWCNGCLNVSGEHNISASSNIGAGNICAPFPLSETPESILLLYEQAFLETLAHGSRMGVN
jgi:hypothetical protein